MPAFAFFYFMSGDPARIRAAVPSHVSHWKNARLANYVGGPFADRSGGLITFDAADTKTAEAQVRKDPFVIQELVGEYWVKEWLRE